MLVIEPYIRELVPDLIIVSAGFDAAEGDLLGGMRLSPACYGFMTATIMRLCPRVVLALEGGYNVSVTAECAAECVAVLLGGKPRAMSGRGAARPAKEVGPVLTAAAAAHAPTCPALATMTKPSTWDAYCLALQTRRSLSVRGRKGLRLHDNPSLLRAIEGAERLHAVFCLDPWFIRPEAVGVNRLSFLLESLADLHSSLQARGSALLVLRGKPEEELPRVWQEWGVTRLCFEVDTEEYARTRDLRVCELAAQAGVDVSTCVSHTLYNVEQVAARNGGSPPLTYKAFEAVLAKLGPPPLPVADPPARLPPGVAGSEVIGYGVPTLAELGYPLQATTVFKGGESVALARLADQLSDKGWVAAFEKPKGDPSAFIKPATTVLSPHLKFGTLSCRLFYARLQQILLEKKQHTKPPVSLVGQLFWREFFYCAAALTPNFHRMEGSPICRQIPWDDNEEFYRAWDEARTGYPWIDAIMMQLRTQGWMHHLARHCVACFLTRGDLYVSWERGRDTFDRLLIDGDPSINSANWLWLSASAFFHQFHRVYSPITFGKKYDPHGKYIRHFLPVLKDMPDKYIYEPWTAPPAVQAAAKCIVGTDYPRPIVDHAAVSRANMVRMKDAYAAGRVASAKAVIAGAKRAPVGGAAGGPALKRAR
ncbi:hypothetical protein WJX81_004006 [Elliptochloris bilobata]|uniref:Photolyase/cryptochrome alpha/beta domain-containing protein n=1 Tax=Elliptochloris bilobata TaxID=381761 RepID=A0AAW1RCT1_9CHLO